MKRIVRVVLGVLVDNAPLTIAAAVTAAVATLALLLWPRPVASDPSRTGDAVCAATVSGTPMPGTPTMLPDGTGTCAP